MADRARYIAQLLGGPDDGSWLSCKAPEFVSASVDADGAIWHITYRFQSHPSGYSPRWVADSKVRADRMAL